MNNTSKKGELNCLTWRSLFDLPCLTPSLCNIAPLLWCMDAGLLLFPLFCDGSCPWYCPSQHLPSLSQLSAYGTLKWRSQAVFQELAWSLWIGVPRRQGQGSQTHHSSCKYFSLGAFCRALQQHWYHFLIFFLFLLNTSEDNILLAPSFRDVNIISSRGVHQLIWVKSKMSLAGTLLPPPTNRLSAYWTCMWRGTVMCHAPHAGTFIEKGWIEEIFNRNRENNKEMNRDNNKINRDS